MPLQAVQTNVDATRMLYSAANPSQMPGMRIQSRVNEALSDPTGVVVVPVSGSSVSTGVGSIKLNNGKALVSPRSSKGVVVETANGKLWVGRGASVIVSQERGVLRVENLNGVGNVHVQLKPGQPASAQNWVSLGPGYELVTSQPGLTRELIQPADGVARRNATISSDQSYSISEVSLPTLLKSSPVLQTVRTVSKSASTQQKQAASVVREVTKMAAVLSVTRGGSGFVAIQDNAVAVRPNSLVTATLDSVRNVLSPSLAVAPPPAVASVSPVVALDANRGVSVASSNSAAARTGNQIQVGQLSLRVSPVALPAAVLASVPTDTLPHRFGGSLSAIAKEERRGKKPQVDLDDATKAASAHRARAENVGPVSVRYVVPTSPVSGTDSGSGRNRRALAGASSVNSSDSSSVLLPSDASDWLDTHAMGHTVREWIKQNPTLALLIGAMFLLLAAFSVYQWRKTRMRERQLSDSVERMAALNHELQVARDQAIESSRLKSEFVANISHEIRTPVSAVLGLNDLLLDTKLDKQQQEFARLSKDSAQSLLGLINDLLDFSKMESGKLELEIVDISVPKIMQDAANLLAPVIHEKALMVMFMSDVKDVALRGDPVRLRQILLNLVGNAVKFTSKGEVVVEAAIATEEADRARLVLTVEDTGIGISEDSIAQLAKPFVQADGSTTRRFGGTGLGLSITKRLAEMMGGGITIESQLGKGSKFQVSMSLNSVVSAVDPAEQADDASKAALGLPDLSGTRVAVFTKHQRCGEVIRQAFRDAGVTIVKRTRDAEFAIFDVNASRKRLPASARRIAIGTSAAAPEGAQYDAYLASPVNVVELLSVVAYLKKNPQLGMQREAPVVATTLQTEPLPMLSRKRVLVAEDSPVLQKIIKNSLEKLGFTVSLASDGSSAVSAAAENSYDLIFMDWQMPVMGGLEATKLIRQSEIQTGQHTPIVAMTANAMQGHRETCLAAGMDDYLSKPFNQQQLSDVLQRWLSS